MKYKNSQLGSNSQERPADCMDIEPVRTQTQGLCLMLFEEVLDD